MVKFFIGPAAGVSLGLSLWETVACTVLGMMMSVVLFTYFGPHLLRWIGLLFRPQRRTFSKRSRRLVRYRQSFGLYGIAIFTPLLFTPILGTLLAVSLGGSKQRILVSMLISGLFWAVVVTWVLQAIKQGIFQ
jgi:uncharacterized membrane protein